MTTTVPAMYERQSGLVPMESLFAEKAAVIGVGAVGRPLAIALAWMGLKNLTIYDFDTVEEVNVPTQGYSRAAVGRKKVDAVEEYIRKRLSGNCAVKKVDQKYEPDKHGLHDVIFCCVDSIEARSEIWKEAGVSTRFWCDARMMGLSLRVLTAYDIASREAYAKSLFPAAEAFPGRCTARSAIWPSSIIVGFLVNQYVMYLNGVAPPIDLAFGLANYDLEVIQSPSA